MSFQKIVMLDGFRTTFSLVDDEAVIEQEEMKLNLKFSMFMTTEERELTLDALADPNFSSKADFLKTMNHEESVQELFTSESYDFMNYLSTLGLSPEISAKTAFLTDLSGTVSFETRKEIFEAFRNSLHSIKLAQTGDFAGITTFTPYYLIAQWGGVKLATRASRKAGDDPEQLFSLLEGIREFRGGKIDDDISDVQFNVLMDFIADGFPNPHVEDSSKLAKFLVELVLSDVDWSVAASHITNNDLKDTDKELLDFIKATIVYEAWGVPKVRLSSQNLIAILKAKYTTQALTNAFEVLKLNKDSITSRNSEHFIAFVAIADYLSTGGDTTDPLDWMVSMEPHLAMDKFFQRIYVPMT